MNVEGVVLTGGASRRMGRDKSNLRIEGVTLGERVVCELAAACTHVTVLGNEPIPGADFLPDAQRYEGPLVALARFRPTAELVFVASCDLPWLESRLVSLLTECLGEDAEAVVPLVEGERQPLCAIYRASSFAKLRVLVDSGHRRMRDWLAELKVVEFDDPMGTPLARGVNTPEEWGQIAHDSL